MHTRGRLTGSGRLTRGARAVLLCGFALLFCPGAIFAQQSTELAGAGGGVFPVGTTYNGVSLSGMRFGMGIDLAVGGEVVGTFEFTLLGLSPGGQPQIITIEGTATGGSGTAGTGATVMGTTRVDMGDGTPPLTSVPFTLAITTDTAGQGTLAMVIGATSLPEATVDKGSLTVAPCRPDLPTLITDSLCAVGPGQVGTHYISLPSHSSMKTAKDLCAEIGPIALTVTQRFPEPSTPDTGLARTWTYDCSSHTCTPGSAVTPPFETGCAPDCFCIDPGEGYEVRSSTQTTFQVKGCESRVQIVLPPGGETYLISVPIHTNLVTWQDLAQHIGLQSTGVVRGVINGLNGCTGQFTTCLAGTIQCSTALLVPGRAYRVRYTHKLGATFVNPTTSTAQCPPPC